LYAHRDFQKLEGTLVIGDVIWILVDKGRNHITKLFVGWVF